MPRKDVVMPILCPVFRYNFLSPSMPPPSPDAWASLCQTSRAVGFLFLILDVFNSLSKPSHRFLSILPSFRPVLPRLLSSVSFSLLLPPAVTSISLL